MVDYLTANGPSSTNAIRRALPSRLVRSLGAEGKKVGISSPLPPALRKLEFSGRVERALEGGRLDTERYLWRAPQVNPFDQVPVPEDTTALHAELAKVFFKAAGLATVKAFSTWAGIAQKDARSALEQIELIPVSMSGVNANYFALADNSGWFQRKPDRAGAVLVPFEDNLIACQGGLQFLVDAAYHSVEVTVWGSSKRRKLGEAKHADLRSVVAEGQIAGFWEYHPDQEAIIHRCFSPFSRQTQQELDVAAADTARFMSQELGHGRSFSLDTDDALRQRVEIVQSL